MVDTIWIELLNQYISSLKNKSDTIDSETGEVKYSVGYSGCIKVREVKGKMIIECSLPKFLKGDNIYSLNYFEVVMALKLVEKKLGISIMKGTIRRLDCEITVESLYKPSTYFRYLGNCKYYVRKEIQKTFLYYYNKSRIVNIYDKIKERKDKKEILPTEFEGKNLLRFECRYKNVTLKKIAKKNYLEVLKVEDLINPAIFINISEIIFKEYKAIDKLNTPAIINFNNSARSKLNLTKNLAYMAIKLLGGVQAVQEMIDASRPYNEDVRSEYFSRRKKDVKDIATNTNIEFTENFISEINEKIKQKYLFIQNSIQTQ
jgi:hypothetical protein